MEDKLNRITTYLMKCVAEIPNKVEGVSDTDFQDIEDVLSAMANVLCFSVNVVGADKDILISNIHRAWNSVVDRGAIKVKIDN